MKRKTLLIIDDNKDILNTLQTLLSENFDNIFIALNGKEGFELFNKYKPELIISDISMPEIDGITLCKKIKSINPFQKIILMSSHSENDKRIKKINCYNFYISKPYSIEELLGYIKDCGIDV